MICYCRTFCSGRYLEGVGGPVCRPGQHLCQDKSDFQTRYQNLLEEIRSPDLTIVLLTIILPGEDLNSPLNQQRMAYNQCIRQLADGYGYISPMSGKASPATQPVQLC